VELKTDRFFCYLILIEFVSFRNDYMKKTATKSAIWVVFLSSFYLYRKFGRFNIIKIEE